MYPLRQPFLVSCLIDYMDINASDTLILDTVLLLRYPV